MPTNEHRLDGLSMPITAKPTAHLRYDTFESKSRVTLFGFRSGDHGMGKRPAAIKWPARQAAASPLEQLLTRANARLEQMPWTDDTSEELEERTQITQAMMPAQSASQAWRDQGE